MRTQNNATQVIIEDYFGKSADKVTPEQRRNRLALQEQLNEQQIEPFSFEAYEKDEIELKLLKELKKATKHIKFTKSLPFELAKDAWKRGFIQKN